MNTLAYLASSSATKKKKLYNMDHRSVMSQRYSRNFKAKQFQKKQIVSTFFGAIHPADAIREYRQKTLRLSKKNSNGACDIVSLIIMHGMWHIVEKIFSYVDAYSLENCEDVCQLWRDYIRNQNIWKKVVEDTARSTPNLVVQVSMLYKTFFSHFYGGEVS